jgi:tRNA A-37 threonylcarbamoyl transferase component Bud32
MFHAAGGLEYQLENRHYAVGIAADGAIAPQFDRFRPVRGAGQPARYTPRGMGRTLGRYELVRPLARGGMGEVYLARRRAAGVEKWLVVKRMRPERSGETRFLDLFMREAKLSMSLAHQNIVPVFDFGRMDDQVFLAMERVEGKDLGSSLARAGTGLPPLLAAFVASECLQALDYAHRRKGPDGIELGIVHRDVTPRNVLLSWSGEVKLTDFGIAALAGDSPSRAAGTPAYMAPEQARGDATDVRADIYAVGLVLREALVGERGRRGNDRETVLELAKQGELEPWPQGFESPLRAIVDRATAVVPDDRYPDARAMLEALDGFIVGERASNKGDAPARQLAAWLEDVWRDARADDEALDAQIEAGVMVSFLDDGPLDVLGSGTQRSLIATVADDGTEGGADPPRDRRASTVPPPAQQAAAASPPARSPRLVAIALLAAAAIMIPIVLLVGRIDGRPADVEGSGRDAAAIVALARDAAMPLIPDAALTGELATDAAVALVELTPDAGVRPRPTPTLTPSPHAQPDAGASTITDKPNAGTRKVTINSKPWSHWTVDGGPQRSGLDTIELPPGPHVIHFTGNPYFKADKKVTINVPDRDGFTYVETLEPVPAP